jgi:predicted  nucleic acid-binding Zn-ribbon protein
MELTVKRDMTIDILLENSEEFIKAFPELTKSFEELKAVKEDEGCPDCKKRAYSRNLVNNIMMLPKKERDLEALIKVSNPTVMHALSYDPDIDNRKIESKNPVPVKLPEIREGCPDCVCKHLSQAYVIMAEIVQGYPEHVRLAIKHAEQAMKYATGKNVKTSKKLLEIKDSLVKVLDDQLDDDKVDFHLTKAKEAMEEILNDSTSHPLVVWKVIGHMGEAADECVEHNPELAMLIREERLALMEDHMYKPPLKMLLNKARKDKK